MGLLKRGEVVGGEGVHTFHSVSNTWKGRREGESPTISKVLEMIAD